MKWRIEVRPAAMADLDESVVWYEAQSVGLGIDFVRAILATISTLALAPLRSRLRHRKEGIRWIYARRFPHRIIYRVESDKVVVLAILHAARDAATWRARERKQP